MRARGTSTPYLNAALPLSHTTGNMPVEPEVLICVACGCAASSLLDAINGQCSDCRHEPIQYRDDDIPLAAYRDSRTRVMRTQQEAAKDFLADEILASAGIDVWSDR